MVAVLDNVWTAQLNSTDLERFASNETTPDEAAYIANIQAFETRASGYRLVQ